MWSILIGLYGECQGLDERFDAKGAEELSRSEERCASNMPLPGASDR